MLLELSINNFAIIEDLSIQFTKGLNLLTGETGSGKSIIIDALGIILGGRGTKDLIKSGEKKATLQAVFFIENHYRFKTQIQEYNIDLDKDNLLIISREIVHNGPSMSRVNGKTVTLSMLNKISSVLVDIFAQQEHQSLLNISRHRLLIDSFGDVEFNELKAVIKSKYEEYIQEKKILESMTMDEAARNREIDLLQFQIDEIDEAKLSMDDEYIEEEYNKLLNLKDIKLGVTSVVESFSNFDYDSPGILDVIGKDISTLNDITRYDKSLEDVLKRLDSVKFELKDIRDELVTYLNKSDIDEERLFILEERFNLVNRLKRKYGNTIKSIIDYRNELFTALTKLLNYNEQIEDSQNKIKMLEEALLNESIKLSNLRKDISLQLEQSIANELKVLSMDNIVFKVNFKNSQYYGPEGIDQIEFLISTNPGEELRSLSKIVSGGEMSRIMLGFKSILAEHDGIPTLIFDEIDTGISGRTAQIVGERISSISKNHQVISISHSPQITALADTHFVISKKLNKHNKMTTNIKKLTKKERIEELARLIGGVDVTNTTLNHAKEMLEMSNKI